MFSLKELETHALSLLKHIPKSPLLKASWLKDDCYLKCESLNETGSFKIRGALSKFLTLTEAEKKNGVVTLSAGNHAQAVSFFARNLGIPATIVMPVNTPYEKVERTKRFGQGNTTILFHGESLFDCEPYVANLIKQHGFTLIHPYDDPMIIKGQSSIGVELIQDLPELNTVIVPVGGGGLCSGIALYLKQYNPAINVIGVQTRYAPQFAHYLYPKRFKLDYNETPSTIAEGIAVKNVGKLTGPLLKKYLDDFILVSEQDIEEAMYDLFTQAKLTVEGAGAASVAALKYLPPDTGKTALLVCGGNLDPKIFSQLLLRALLHRHKIVQLYIPIDDKPGVLARISAIIASTGANIVQAHHQRLFNVETSKMADLELTIETRDKDHINEILALLKSEDFVCRMKELN